jgi:DNA polymerase-1
MNRCIVLIDGSSYLFRAYHAMPDLRSPSGRPTGAIYGVVSMIKKLLKDHPLCTHMACVFDAKGKNFRDDLFPEYKAHRPSMPEDLAEQIEPLHACIRHMGIKVLVKPGVEADDVLGTLACQAKEHGDEVWISTGDKDMAQLVCSGITLVNTMTQEVLDDAGVVRKFGVRPDQIIDYLSLVGDSADGIPGVPKCGPKTAQKWLQTYGHLDQLVSSAHEIKGVVGENLRLSLEWLPIAKTLVTIKKDVDLQELLPLGLNDLLIQDPDHNSLAQDYQSLGFKSWLHALLSSNDQDNDSNHSDDKRIKIDKATSEYVMIHTIESLRELRDRLMAWNGLVAIDTETNSLSWSNAVWVGMSVALQEHQAYYIPIAHQVMDERSICSREDVISLLKPWLESPNHFKVGQNLKFDLHIFANEGITLRGIADDTLLASYVHESHLRHNLDELIQRHLGHAPSLTFEDVCGKGSKQITFDQVNLDTATQYAAEDADATLQVMMVFNRIMDEPRRNLYRHVELPIQEVLWAMERYGVLIDVSLLKAQNQSISERLVHLEHQAHALATQVFNLNSPKQLQYILFDVLGLPTKDVRKTPTGGYSTDEEVLAKLALDHPLPKCLLEYRTLNKLKSSYTDKLPSLVHPHTGRIHTTYAQAVVMSGRLASSDPNLQNIPVRTEEGRAIRRAFIAPPEHLIISADYSQVELRIMAHFSQDLSMLRAFSLGEDIHRATASELFDQPLDKITSEERRYAKTINFGLIYGMSAFGLANQLGIERSKAQLFMDRYFERYPGVKRFMEDVRSQAKINGYIDTLYGRRLYLPDIRSNIPAKRAAAERLAINAPMQGTAADIIKRAMLSIYRWMNEEHLQSKMIMQVHDELVFEVPQHELEHVKKHVLALMESAAGENFSVPLVVDIGEGLHWDDAH